MAYQLWVTGNYKLSGMKFHTMNNAAVQLGGALGDKQIEFVVQSFDRDGKFVRAFGGTAQPGELGYNGYTSGDETVKKQMRRFARYLLGGSARLSERRFGGNRYSA